MNNDDQSIVVAEMIDNKSAGRIVASNARFGSRG